MCKLLLNFMVLLALTLVGAGSLQYARRAARHDGQVLRRISAAATLDLTVTSADPAGGRSHRGAASRVPMRRAEFLPCAIVPAAAIRLPFRPDSAAAGLVDQSTPAHLFEQFLPTRGPPVINE